METPFISTKEITWLSIDRGWGNGYVHLPKGHKWYGVDYDDIPVDIHGGLTYAREEDDHWVIGFDTAHYQDNKQNWSKEAVEAETQRLLEQCL